MIGWVQRGLPRYNIYATLRLNNKSGYTLSLQWVP